MGFYNIPIVVFFLIAIMVACFQNRAVKFEDKLKLMGEGVGDPNIFTMILIFMMAGIFVGVVGRSSADSVAYFILSIIPAQFSVAVLFIVSCFVSLAMGTSVGIMDIATANNTVAIVMANPIAKEMSVNYEINNKKAASILDTFSCIFQGILPYGAQMLILQIIYSYSPRDAIIFFF